MQAETLDRPTSTIPSKLFSPDDLARLVGVTRETILDWHAAGELPAAAFRVKRSLRWTEDQSPRSFPSGGPDELPLVLNTRRARSQAQWPRRVLVRLVPNVVQPDRRRQV